MGLLSKNILIQGDEASGQPGASYKYGGHTACFFGGEMRIENVEFTRTGQAANLGRYSSHWHNLSPGRNGAPESHWSLNLTIVKKIPSWPRSWANFSLLQL